MKGEYKLEKKWFNKTINEVKDELQTDCEKGLTNEQVLKNREKYG